MNCSRNSITAINWWHQKVYIFILSFGLKRLKRSLLVAREEQVSTFRLTTVILSLILSSVLIDPKIAV